MKQRRVSRWVLLGQLVSLLRPASTLGEDGMRKVLETAVLVCVGLLSTGFGPPSLTDSADPQFPLFVHQIAGIRKAEPPQVAARTAAVVDGATGRLVYDKEAHRRVAPASITKIVTAIVALENVRLDDRVKIDVDAASMLESSVMGLSPGEELTLEDLLYGLMLPSGNDAAIAIARHIAGSEARFAEMMNQKVAELGLTDTHFINSHGLDADGHYSTAYDMAILARYAMRNPIFAKIVSTKEWTARGKRTYRMINGNPALGVVDGVDGVKTGYTEIAGRTLLVSVTRQQRRIFISLMDTQDRVGDTRLLADYIFENYAWVELGTTISPLYTLADGAGTRRPLGLAYPWEETLPLWQLGYLRSIIYLADPMPTDPVEPRGKVVFRVGDMVLVELPIYLQ